MASDESEADGQANGKYISSFVSFLKGNKESGGENNSRDTVKEASDASLDSVKKMEEESSAPEGNVNGSPSHLHGNSEGGAPSPKAYPEKERNSGAFTDDIKELDPSSETDSRSAVTTGKNVAKRGRKRKLGEAGEAPQRATPRRAARNVKCYVDVDEIDEMRSSDPDYNLSDSDDDPDFDPSVRVVSPFRQGAPHPMEAENRPKRGRGGRGRARGWSRGMNLPVRGAPGRQSLETGDEDSNPVVVQTGSPPVPLPAVINHEESSNGAPAQRRRGRPPVYHANAPSATLPVTLSPSELQRQSPPPQISDNTVSSTDDATKVSSGRLSSAYHYAAARSRQNQAIRLPEGPNLTAEQLKLIESQFKSGDFVMAKKDTDMMEHPPIWRIDGKSLLQKFQAFEKDGKMLYRNISTYSGWTSQAKALYLPVRVNFVFQSRYDTVVELVGFKGLPGAAGTEGTVAQDETAQIIDKPVWLPRNKDFEISEELRAHMPSFEIYLQTLISQALDNNFLQEIYDENDAYFVDRVQVIDELTDQRKAKILHLAQWDSKFQASLDTWPCVNTMVTPSGGRCEACVSRPAAMLSQFYGQPYDQRTLRSREPSSWHLDHKNFETCDACSRLSLLYNKVAHQKYEYYSQCKSTVTNVRVSHPNKSTTNVLRDLLANDDWITGLFRSMCTTWIKVDNLNEDQDMTVPREETPGPAPIPAASSAPTDTQDSDPDDPATMTSIPTTFDEVKKEGEPGAPAGTPLPPSTTAT